MMDGNNNNNNNDTLKSCTIKCAVISVFSAIAAVCFELFIGMLVALAIIPIIIKL